MVSLEVRIQCIAVDRVQKQESGHLGSQEAMNRLYGTGQGYLEG